MIYCTLIPFLLWCRQDVLIIPRGSVGNMQYIALSSTRAVSESFLSNEVAAV